MEAKLKRANSCLRSLSPVKHKVSVCTGSACMRRGSGHAIREIKEMLQIRENPVSADGKVRLDAIACSGNCEMAPLVIADNALIPVSDLGSIKTLIGRREVGARKNRATRLKRQSATRPLLA